MKKFFTLLIMLTAIVSVASATDYSIGADEGGWKIKGQMTANGDGTYSYIINFPANYRDYLFTIFEGNAISWDNAYRPKGAVGDLGLGANNTPTMEKKANNYVLTYPVSSTIARAIKVDFNPETGVLVATRLIAVISDLNGWSRETDYLEETSRASNVYTGVVGLNTSGFKYVGIGNWSLAYYSKNGDKIEKDVSNETVDANGFYTLTANFNDKNWVAPVRVTTTATVGAKGYATFCNADYALDFTGKSITAYTVNASGTALTLTAKAKVAKGEPVLLYSKTTGDSQSIPTILDSDATTEITNKLKAGDGNPHTWTDGTKHYILYTGGDNPGFYKANNSMVAVGKAYLDLTGVSASREFFAFPDDETTGINGVENGNVEAKATVIYNMNGQRVMNPSKGLYIVNGKKVIIK